MSGPISGVLPRFRVLGLVLAALISACVPPPPGLPTAAVSVGTGSRAPTLPPPVVATPSALPPTAAPTSIPSSATPQPTPCAQTVCVFAAPHAVFARPIAAGGSIYPDRTYPYGSTQGGRREPHHGVEFFNPAGVAVLAAADGVVIFAGSDTGSEQVGPQPGFYGNVVVLEHHLPDSESPVFTLYAHLRRIDVAAGQAVTVGAQLGEVGQTGIAIGPHLHFEVRVGANTYAATRNPELWLAPLHSRGEDWGALAGIVVGPDGERLPDVAVVVRAQDVSDSVTDKYLTTYSGADNNGDDLLHENFGLGDLPPGTYRVGVNGLRTVIETVTIAPGSVTLVRFTIEPPPPTETPDPNATPTPTETATPDPFATPSETATVDLLANPAPATATLEP